MQELIKICKEYENLKLELGQEQILLSKKVGKTIYPWEYKKFPRIKRIEDGCNKMRNHFFETLSNYGKKNNLTNEELTIQVFEEMLNSNFENISEPLFIGIMEDVAKKRGSFCIKTLDKMIKITQEQSEIHSDDQDSLLNILMRFLYNNSIELIPIRIIEKIILFKLESERNSSLTMATEYLQCHTKKEVEEVLAKARETSTYKENSYVRELIDEVES